MATRKGPWTVEEDHKLINYINTHGLGHWNSLAESAGLNRSGRSCRLRWINYLNPDVRNGNLTLEEQFMILHFYCCWGNRWSMIAKHLPGRTDNEVKNYWRTRIQKLAKQLNCQPNTEQFKDAIRNKLLPRLLEQISTHAPIVSNYVDPVENCINTGNIVSTVEKSLPCILEDEEVSLQNYDHCFEDFDNALESYCNILMEERSLNMSFSRYSGSHQDQIDIDQGHDWFYDDELSQFDVCFSTQTM